MLAGECMMLPVKHSYHQMVSALLGRALARFQALSHFQHLAELHLTADRTFCSGGPQQCELSLLTDLM